MRWPRFLTLPRGPDFVIGPDDDPYLLRWYVLPKNDRIGGIYSHRFLRSDDDWALHDHPRHNVSVLLWGRYREHLADGSVRLRKPWRPWAPWRIIVRSATLAHRIELIDKQPVWTLFLTGPHIREWGFLCPQGWRHWRDYAEVRDGGNSVGRGCE